MRLPRPSCVCNRLLLDLQRGPVLGSDIGGDAARIVRDLNRYVLAEIGARVVGRRVRRPTKWGLAVRDTVYRLEWLDSAREAA